MAVIRHLYNPATDTHYTNGGYIHSSHPLPEQGWQWLEGPAPSGAILYNPPSLFEQVDALIKTLSLASQAAHYAALATVKQAVLAGDVAVAYTLVTTLLQPQSPEETTVFSAMAAVLNDSP